MVMLFRTLEPRSSWPSLPCEMMCTASTALYCFRTSATCCTPSRFGSSSTTRALGFSMPSIRVWKSRTVGSTNTISWRGRADHFHRAGVVYVHHVRAGQQREPVRRGRTAIALAELGAVHQDRRVLRQVLADRGQALRREP